MCFLISIIKIHKDSFWHISKMYIFISSFNQVFTYFNLKMYVSRMMNGKFILSKNGEENNDISRLFDSTKSESKWVQFWLILCRKKYVFWCIWHFEENSQANNFWRILKCRGHPTNVNIEKIWEWITYYTILCIIEYQHSH